VKTIAKILVVDDEPDILELARLMLESQGYMVATESSGEDALRSVDADRPDLVLLDAVMPGLSGLDVCRRLKRGKETRGIPVVMFTALGPEVDLMLAEGEKADGYILKPFTRKQLLDKVENLLDQV